MTSLSKKRRGKHIEKAQKETVQRKANALDSFTNALSNLGVGTQSLMQATQYPITRLTRNYNLMNSLYRNSWIIKKVINTIPDDMTKNWFSISSEMTPDDMDRYNTLEKKTKIKSKIREGLYWARLYGGAAALMLIEGQEGMLSEPLDVDKVLPGSFHGIHILDRWSGVYPSLEIVTDITDPSFGLPKYYEVTSVNEGIIEKVHHSRIIRLPGRKLPHYENEAEQLWGASEVEHIYDELVKRDNTSANISALIFQANLLVNKVEGLDQILAVGDIQGQNDLYNVKKAQNEMRNNNSMMVVGKEEGVEQMQYTFSGINDIYESFMLDLSGAADIPVTRLFGRSPAGMNATGESDMQMYYDMINQQQESYLRPILDQLLPVMFMSEFGMVPSDLDMKFNPVKSFSAKESADIVNTKVTAIVSVFEKGIINQKQALMELHEMSYTTDMFTSITDEDIEDASTDFVDETDISNYINTDFGDKKEV